MRRLLIAFALVVAAPLANAADILGPADYLKIMSDSKLRYSMLASPSKSPVQEMTCDRRTEESRVVVENGNRRLVNWPVKEEAKVAFDAGERLFGAKDYAGAAEKYKAAIAADPDLAAAYFTYGDTLLFGKNDPAAALAQYEKGLALDPTLPSGHFFEVTALLHLGRLADAREQVIKALTYYPEYPAVWKIVDESRWNLKPIVRHKFEPPAGYLGKTDNAIEIYGGPKMEWLGYAMCKAAWANEKQFRNEHVPGGWSIEEERACVTNQLMTQFNATESKLEEATKKKNIPEGEVLAALPPLERHLYDVVQAGLLDGYILFEIIGRHCPLALSTMNDAGVKQIDGYIRRYVIVAR